MASTNPNAGAQFDPHRFQVALAMIADLSTNNTIPRPHTPITQWTHQFQNQIAWPASFNNSPRPAQNGYGWKHVLASEVGACNLIDDLIALVYSKLVPPQPLGPVVSGLQPQELQAHLDAFTAPIAKKKQGKSKPGSNA